MSIRDALALRRKTVILKNGMAVDLRRPSALDLVEAVEFSNANASKLHGWLVWRHLMDGDQPAFECLEHALGSDAMLVTEIAQHVEALYSEGRD